MSPGDEGDISDTLVARADDDLSLIEAVRELPGVSDGIVGFHAQQATEKLLKAVLTRRRVEYPFTHDLERLIELVEEATGTRPPDADELAALTPWAVEFRYGDVTEEEGLDRDSTLARLQRVRAWATQMLASPSS